MNDSKVLSALNYFSIFLAPFLVPLIIFFVSANPTVKYHAKRAFLSHLIPVIAGIVMALIFFTSTALGLVEENVSGALFIVWVLLMALYGILSLAVTIWNIVQGIRVLR